MKYLCVLLTKYPDRFARVLARLSGRGYTHASIGLEDGNRFYSFSFRGFTEETPDKLRRRGVTASRCYRIPVADGAYRLVETRLRAMAAPPDMGRKANTCRESMIPLTIRPAMAASRRKSRAV